MTTDDDQRDELAAANRILAGLEVVDGWGHVSVRSGARADRFLIARSIAPATVTPEDVLELDIASGEPVGDGRSYLERHIHAAIYRARSDVRSVVHCHTPELIPFGVTDVPLRPVSHVSAFLGEGAPVFEIRDVDPAGAGMLVDSPALGDGLARSLGPAPIVLMRGHGATIVGNNLRQAVYRAFYAGQNAALQRRAAQLGTVRFLSQAEADHAGDLIDQTLDRTWQLWRHAFGP